MQWLAYREMENQSNILHREKGRKGKEFARLLVPEVLPSNWGLSIPSPATMLQK